MHCVPHLCTSLLYFCKEKHQATLVCFFVSISAWDSFSKMFQVLNSLKAQAGCAAVSAPGQGSLSTCWGQTFLALPSSAFPLSIFWWNEAILIERNAMYSVCLACFLKSLNFFSYFSSTLGRKIKIQSCFFFPNKNSCCVHVYMMFDSVWSLQINFMRKLNFRNFLLQWNNRFCLW